MKIDLENRFSTCGVDGGDFCLEVSTCLHAFTKGQKTDLDLQTQP